MIFSMFLTASLVAGYTFPGSYPPADQSKFIPDEFLKDPIILQAIEQVKSIITPEVWNIKPSTYQAATPNAPAYNDNPIITCYWPFNGCTNSSRPGIASDLTQCPGFKYLMSGTNTWGISFDDGPYQNIVNGKHVNDSVTIQELLETQNLKATFFLIGGNVLLNPSIVQGHVKAGHQIALHTWSHHPMTCLTSEQVVAEILYNEAVIYDYTGVIPNFLRPPYGDVDDRVRAISQALGKQIVLWDPKRDSHDSDYTPTDENFQKVVGNITSWFVAGSSFISLQHDAKTFTVGTAVDSLKTLFSLNPRPLELKTVATCLNLQFYSNTNATQILPPFVGTGSSNRPLRGSKNSASVNVIYLGLVFMAAF